MTDRLIDEVITDLADDVKDLVDFAADCAVDLAHKAIEWFTPKAETVKEETKQEATNIVTTASSILNNLDPELLGRLVKAAASAKAVKK